MKAVAFLEVRHMVEVLIEDFGYDELGKHVKKPLDGIKIAGYVGCQTNRPFGIDGESFENPKYLDKLVETMGAEPVDNYDKKVSCCGGALAFSEPEKSQALIKDIIEAAYDGGADMIVTPCPVCQMNVEVYQDQINAQVQDQIQDAGGVLFHSDIGGLWQECQAGRSGWAGDYREATQ